MYVYSVSRAQQILPKLCQPRYVKNIALESIDIAFDVTRHNYKLKASVTG